MSGRPENWRWEMFKATACVGIAVGIVACIAILIGDLVIP